VIVTVRRFAFALQITHSDLNRQVFERSHSDRQRLPDLVVVIGMTL